MIRVALVLTDDKWMGGINYLKNLVKGVSLLDETKIKLFLFTGKHFNEKIVSDFDDSVTVVRETLFDKKSISYKLWKLEEKYLKSHILFDRVMKRYHIDVVSHGGILGKKLPYKTINWIPDFQHLHLTRLFENEEIESRNRYYSDLIRQSDAMVLSSNNAYTDYKNFVNDQNPQSVYIMHFASYIDRDIFMQNGLMVDIESKFDLPKHFFYLPNQFWEHKNHRIVFEAVKKLKNQQKNITVVCTGLLDDFRNRDHIEELMGYIESNGLNDHIKILGVVGYREVLYLMKRSIAVINPSFFEGWSSSVEESKAMDHLVILSNIDVHKEQNPQKGVFFDPENVEQLADILWHYWEESLSDHDAVIPEKKEYAQMIQRLREFGETYQNIILKVVKVNNGELL